MPPSSDHWKSLAELSEKIPSVVISLISPPLAPHSPAPLTFSRLVKLSKTLLCSEEDEMVTFVGDSSGRNVVLAVMLETLKSSADIKRPANLMLIAPVQDLRFISSKIRDVERHDPVLRLPIEIKTAKSWTDYWVLSDPRLSPVLADLTILNERRVKVHGLAGGYDILTPDTLLFRDKCEAAGICGENRWSGRSRCIAFQSLSPIICLTVWKGRIGSLMC